MLVVGVVELTVLLLMLMVELVAVVEAVEEGVFHLFAVEEVDEAVELLFGRRAYWVHEKVREALEHFQKLENGDGEKG